MSVRVSMKNFREANVAEMGIKIESQTKKNLTNSPLFYRNLII
jgi:hypothetical protein